MQMGLVFRPATTDDLDRIMELYDVARRFMRANGNTVQWVNGYPRRELIEQDIDQGISIVCERDGAVEAVMAVIGGDDPTYAEIEGGEWLDDEPYHTVHRLAVGGSGGGIGSACMQWALREHGNVRVDTHESNEPMKGMLEKNGFVRCGIIYIEDGTPRVAYQRHM